MKIIRKIRHDGYVGAWHVHRPGDGSRYLCKQFIRKYMGTKRMEYGDLRNLKNGDRICVNCAKLSPELAQRLRLVRPGNKIGVVAR